MPSTQPSINDFVVIITIMVMIIMIITTTITIANFRGIITASLFLVAERKCLCCFLGNVLPCPGRGRAMGESGGTGFSKAVENKSKVITQTWKKECIPLFVLC